MTAQLHVSPLVKEEIEKSLHPKERKHLDKYLYILSTILLYYTFHRKECDYLYNGFAPIQATLIRAVCGNKYSELMQWLIKNEYLLSDNHYVPQSKCPLGIGKSKGYKLHPRIAQLPPAIVKPEEKTAKKIAKVKAKARYTPETETEQYLKDQLLQFSIRPEALEQIEAEGNKPTDITLYHAILSKEHLFERGGKGTRIFTTFAVMKRSIRPYLIHESGAELWELDCRNSQPLILCTLFAEYFKDQLPDDAKLYQSLCEAGKLYRHVANLCSKYLAKAYAGLTEYEADQQFKEDMFGLVYYCYHNEKKHPIRDAFKQAFPSLWKLIKYYKRNDYRHLSILMQQRERQVIIDRVCTRLIQTTGGTIPLITIHDSIVTTKPFRWLVKAEIEQAMQEMYGIKPTVKADKL